MRIIAIDPAGDWTKGKGVTGYIEVDVVDNEIEIVRMGSIRAEKFETRLDYWEEHLGLLTTDTDLAIIEDYRLYNHTGASAAMQTGSYLETPRLLGLLEYWAKHNNIDTHWQMARDTVAFKENILIARGILKKVGNRYYYKGLQTNDHIRSAIKHLYRYLGGKK